MKQIKKAFTLVELIIVIVILAILASISFITLRGYPREARDTVRKADLTNIKKVLDIYKIQSPDGKYPSPDGPVTKSGSWDVGKFGIEVLAKINNLSPLPVDPNNGGYYDYAVSDDGQHFKLISKLEENDHNYTVSDEGIIEGNTETGSSGGGNNSGTTGGTTPILENGTCGSSDGIAVASKPTTNLCSKGTASPVSGTGPWSWTCAGQNGGTSVNCTATKKVAVTSVQNPNTPVTFEKHSTDTLDGVTGYYIQLNTNLKWEANPSGTAQWATDTSYREPTWNGTNYLDPIDDSIIDGENTKYPAFAHCVKKGLGWRLPTKRELFSITTNREKNSSGKFTKLPSITYTHYWSATEDASDAFNAWYGLFIYGTVDSTNKTSALRVHCTHD